MDEGEEFRYLDENTVENSDIPATMPEDYYEKFESFMKMCPPALTVEKEKLKGKTTKSPNKECNSNTTSQKSVSLPAISRKDKAAALPPRPAPNVVSKVAESLKPQRKEKARPIDMDLLMQAFAYTDQLANEAFLMEQQEAIAAVGKCGSAPDCSKPPQPGASYGNYSNSQPRSAPDLVSAVGGGGGLKKAGSVKKLRQKVLRSISASSVPAEFSVSVIPEEEQHRKVSMDVDALVTNFEQGLMLQRLQAELAESQRSMAKSEEFMMQLRRDFGKER